MMQANEKGVHNCTAGAEQSLNYLATLLDFVLFHCLVALMFGGTFCLASVQ